MEQCAKPTSYLENKAGYKFGEDKGSKVTKEDRVYNAQRLRIYTKSFWVQLERILYMTFNDLWVVSRFFSSLCIMIENAEGARRGISMQANA